MTRRKALTIALSLAGVSGLVFVLLLLSQPAPAVSHASYAWKPGCHCGAPKTTTTTAKKVTTTTAKKVTTTTAKATAAKATTTTKPTTTTTAKASTTTTKSTTTTSTTTAAGAKKSTKKSTKKTTTTTSGDDGQKTDLLALGAAVSGSPGGGDGSGGDGSGGSGLPGVEATAAETSGPPHYYLSPVAIAFLLVYAVSFALYRTKRMKVTTHRKIWNMLLLGTFLMCGILGLVLTVSITRATPWELPPWLLVWHVETGIAMSVISVFHVGWHLRYYLALVTGRRRAARPERAAARRPEPARDALRKPRTTRPVPVRTEAERRMAFEQRMAGRTGETNGSRSAGARTEADRWLEDARRRAVPAS